MSITFEATNITAGPDGNMWFAGSGGIGKFDPFGGPVTMVESQVPATSIAPSACFGALWFTSGSESVGEITTPGKMMSLTALPTAGSNPQDITAAPDGSAWLTEPDGKGGQIARAIDPAAVTTCVYLLTNDRFSRAQLNLPHPGEVVHWMMQAPGTHGVADASGMKLFGFGSPTVGPVPVPIGSFASFQFNWAGTFRYDDPFHPAAKAKVAVPIKVAPVRGSPGEANVTWASGDAPPGFGFDVQLQPPGSPRWITWQSAVTSLSAPFGPSDPLWAGPGTYRFRARLRQLTSNVASGYSPPKPITLT